MFVAFHNFMLFLSACMCEYPIGSSISLSFVGFLVGLGLLHFLSHFLHKFSQFQKLSENPPLSSSSSSNNNNNKFVTSQKSWWVNAWMNHIAKVSQIAFSSSSFLR
jgi:hypothetical protein